MAVRRATAISSSRRALRLVLPALLVVVRDEARFLQPAGASADPRPGAGAGPPSASAARRPPGAHAIPARGAPPPRARPSCARLVLAFDRARCSAARSAPGARPLPSRAVQRCLLRAPARARVGLTARALGRRLLFAAQPALLLRSRAALALGARLRGRAGGRSPRSAACLPPVLLFGRHLGEPPGPARVRADPRPGAAAASSSCQRTARPPAALATLCSTLPPRASFCFASGAFSCAQSRLLTLPALLVGARLLGHPGGGSPHRRRPVAGGSLLRRRPFAGGLSSSAAAPGRRRPRPRRAPSDRRPGAAAIRAARRAAQRRLSCSARIAARRARSSPSTSTRRTSSRSTCAPEHPAPRVRGQRQRAPAGRRRAQLHRAAHDARRPCRPAAGWRRAATRAPPPRRPRPDRSAPSPSPIRPGR